MINQGVTAGNKKYIIVFGLLALALLLEIFLFNFRHWQSVNNQEITDYSLVLGDGILEQMDHTYILNEGNKYLEFNEINKELNTLYIDIQILDSENRNAEIQLSARDESHEIYYGMPARQIYYSQEKSKYLTFHLYGKCKSLKIFPMLNDGEHVRISYKLNPVIPVFFSWGRVFGLWIIFLACYFLRPSSFIYQIRFLDMQRNKNILLVSFFLLHMLCAGLMIHVNPFFRGEPAANHEQYQKLAESLSQGRAYLLEEPPQVLQEMENPYDYNLREQVMEESGEWYLWDYAYYEGKYYVYFGVVPEILFYLPYYLLTGTHLHNYQVIFIGAGMVILGMMGIIYQVIKRWFPETSIGAWYLLSELMILGSGLIYMCKRPDMYTVPIIVGLGLGLLGIWCFLCAERDNSLLTGYLVLGSLCMALIAGCRPQLFLMVLPAAVLLRKYIFSFSYIRTKEGIKNMAGLAAPMITVAVFLMYYNYIRFGSPVDFGANYNLTFNDMRNRGFVPDRLPLGIFAYLFAPLKTTLDFPFTEANYFQSQYMGITISEATYGGIFAVNLFAWLGPALLLFRKYLKKNTVISMAYISMLAAVIIICADTEMSGILMRYFGDFNVFFMLAAAFSWLILFKRAENRVLKKFLLLFLVVCLFLSIVYQIRIFFLDTGEALIDLRKDLFVQVKYGIMFWL